MAGGGFDLWGSQALTSAPAHAPTAHASLDLNSQVPAAAGFLAAEEETLNFGASSSVAVRRGGGNAGVFLGGSSTGAGSSVRAPRSAVRGQASGSGPPFGNGDEELEDDVEELGSFGGPSVSQTNRAQWNDANNACLLELCLEQRATGTYSGAQMSGEGYQAVVDGLLARRRLVYTRLQVKNQMAVLKNTQSFWQYLQVHTGLGRKPDGTIDAESEWWKTHTEKKPYLKKLQWGPPANEDLLDQLFGTAKETIPKMNYCGLYGSS